MNKNTKFEGEKKKKSQKEPKMYILTARVTRSKLLNLSELEIMPTTRIARISILVFLDTCERATKSGAQKMPILLNIKLYISL